MPFEVRRIFYVYGAEEKKVRGKHANRRSRFALISISGKCKVRVIDECAAETKYIGDFDEFVQEVKETQLIGKG